MVFYAHSRNEAGVRHDLVKHLLDVAAQARTYADKFGAGDLAYWAGLWHDVGKFNPRFQDYLIAQEEGRRHPKVPHAFWGASILYTIVWGQHHNAESWKEIAIPIAGHHTGLANGGTVAQDFEAFLAANKSDIPVIASHLKELGAIPELSSPASNPTRREMRLRMSFSALVDADYLDTEKHFNSKLAGARQHQSLAAMGLSERAAAKHQELVEKAEREDSPRVNAVRQEVYACCLEAGPRAQGVYRLTVPTGGGKTLSSLAFALNHAEQHGLDRVIVAIPYTSIIDQTAKTYRETLGADLVLEHHSQYVPPEDESIDERSVRLRLASENWDTPIVITTTVQLFESLLGRRPSRVRKLHNLARSVIVLDEVQTLPTEILEPTLDVLRTLVEDYGVTLVLSTATQPALEDSHYLKAFHGLAVSEIVPEYQRHFQELRRVDYELRPEPISWEGVADEVAAAEQVMVILNCRRDALALIKTLSDQGVTDIYHLSTLLCGAHRRKVLDEVKARLDDGQPVRLICTQVIEAGVDIDFPIVWRAIGPLDRIVQAAGRCNRNGRWPSGRVVIFEPAEGSYPRGPYAAGIVEARAILERYGAQALHDPEIYRAYFSRLFAVVPTDKKGIQDMRTHLSYPEVEKQYKLIEEDTVQVVVIYGEAAQRLDSWRQNPTKETWQQLQPFIVSIYSREARMHVDGFLSLVSDSSELYEWTGTYDERIGLAQVLSDPSDLVYVF